MSDNDLTSIPEIPESIVKWGRCLLLHEKVPIMTKSGINYICKICERIKKK
jgi:hypothetical protein